MESNIDYSDEEKFWESATDSGDEEEWNDHGSEDKLFTERRHDEIANADPVVPQDMLEA